MNTHTDMVQFWKDAHDRACKILDQNDKEIADLKAAVKTAQAAWRGEESELLVRFAVAFTRTRTSARAVFDAAQECVDEFKRRKGL